MSVYGQWATDVLNAWLPGKTLKAIAITPAYTQDQVNHLHLSDIQAIAGAELQAAGYTPGGVVLPSFAATWDAANVRQVLSCGNVDFGLMGVPVTVSGIVVYVDTGNPATSDLVCADISDSPFTVPANQHLIYQVDPTNGFAAIGAY
jgi:hypothetical protein